MGIMPKLIVLTTLLATLCVTNTFADDSDSGNIKNKKMPVAKTDVFDSIGEMLRSINAIEGIKPALSDQDPVSESARGQHKIPDRVAVVSPHGGTDIAVFVYRHEDSIPITGNTRIIISPTQYKHLTSQKNLSGSYLLFEGEPLRIGDQTYAFKKNPNGKIDVFYVAGDGHVEEASIESGQSIFVAGGKYIVKGVVNR